MPKEYRDAITRGIVNGIGVAIPISIIQGRIPWVYLFTFPIFSASAHFFFNKRREAKKEEGPAEGVR